MNRQILLSASSEWVRQAKNDIRNRMMQFMQEVNTSRSELAYALAISEAELAQILDGNGEITLTTFAKLLIATGNVLEIKPVEESPLAMENGAPVPPAEQPQGFTPQGRPIPNHPQRPQGGFGPGTPMPMPQRPGAPMRRPGTMPPPPPGLFDDFHRQEMPEPAPVGVQPRGANGRFKPWPKPVGAAGQQQRPPFSTMEREQLVDIIQSKLWDGEIDVESASREQLVHFLEDKDRRMAELRAARNGGGVAIDPSVVNLKNKIKDTLEKNPHLRNYLRDIFQED